LLFDGIGKVPDRVRASPSATPNRKRRPYAKETDVVRVVQCAIAVIALYCARNVWATPASGFVGKTVAVGRFGDIDVFNHAILPDPDREGDNGKAWISWQKTKGASDVYVQNNVWDREAAPVGIRTRAIA